MNRYIAGGLLAALVLLVSSGLNGLGRLLPVSGITEPPRPSEREALGTSPIEQAGRVVQRQSGATVAVPDTTFQDPTIRSGNGAIGAPVAPLDIPETEIRPQTPNVIPRPGEAPQATTVTGDVSPIQPELIQPGATDRPGIDQDLDSIPALW
jgi:hypothetical protein